MAKKKPKSHKRAKARIQKAASKKTVIKLTPKELKQVQKRHSGSTYERITSDPKRKKAVEKEMAKLKDEERLRPTTPDEAAARRLGRD